MLLEASQTLQKAEGQEAILEAMAVQLRKLLERTALYYPVLPDGTLGQPRFFPVEPTVDTGAYLGPDETAVASWVQKNNKHAGATTNTLSNAKCLYLAVRGEGSALAVAGIAIEEGREPDAFEKNLMLAIVDECGLVLEKELLGQEKHRVEEQAQQEALRANLLRAISHDLRTPLTAIKGWAETLQEGAGPETTAKGMNVIIRESERLSGLVEELLDFSRLQNGRLKMTCRPLDLVAELTDAVLFCEARIQREGLVLVYNEPEEMIPVYADPDRLRQVFINILDNAIKYSAPGGRITVKLWAGEYKAFIELIDQGRGIPPEDLENVKTKFYKGSNSVRGSGIGLALVDSIMTALDGTMDIKSTLGRGTVVTLGLPLYKK